MPKTRKSTMLFGASTIAILAACGLTVGCEEESSLEDAAEDTGEYMEDTADDAGDAIEDGYDDTSDALEDAGDDIEDNLEGDG